MARVIRRKRGNHLIFQTEVSRSSVSKTTTQIEKCFEYKYFLLSHIFRQAPMANNGFSESDIDRGWL